MHGHRLTNQALAERFAGLLSQFVVQMVVNPLVGNIAHYLACAGYLGHPFAKSVVF